MGNYSFKDGEEAQFRSINGLVKNIGSGHGVVGAVVKHDDVSVPVTFVGMHLQGPNWPKTQQSWLHDMRTCMRDPKDRVTVDVDPKHIEVSCVTNSWHRLLYSAKFTYVPKTPVLGQTPPFAQTMTAGAAATTAQEL